MNPSARDTNGSRSTPELVRSVAVDTAALIRAEADLARHEIVDAITSRLKAAGAIAAAGAIGFLALAFGLAAVVQVLALSVAFWLANLIVALGTLMIALLAVRIGARKTKPPMAPRETVRTVKEEVGWAKELLKH
jgi:hypothetical protein